MTPKWYSAYNRTTRDSRTFRSNNPIGVAFEMLGGDKYWFKETEDGWLVDDIMEIREMKNVNPDWRLR